LLLEWIIFSSPHPLLFSSLVFSCVIHRRIFGATE
jgi:hypothetical protein